MIDNTPQAAPTPIPACAPVLRPAELLGEAVTVGGGEDVERACVPNAGVVEVVEVDMVEVGAMEAEELDWVDVEDELEDEDNVKRSDGAGALKVSLVGALQEVSPLAFCPQQAHFWLVKLYTTSGKV